MSDDDDDDVFHSVSNHRRNPIPNNVVFTISESNTILSSEIHDNDSLYKTDNNQI